MDTDTASGPARRRAVTQEGAQMATKKKNRTARTGLTVWASPATLLLKLLIELFKN